MAYVDLTEWLDGLRHEDAIKELKDHRPQLARMPESLKEIMQAIDELHAEYAARQPFGEDMRHTKWLLD